MPRLPTVEGPSVSRAALPDAYQRAPDALGEAGRVGANQLQQASRVAMGVADQAQRALDELDQVRVDDAINRLKERQLDLTFGKDTGFTHQKGLAALERPDGRPLSVEYSEQLMKSAGELANGLGTERQKRLFGLRSNDIIAGFRGQVMAHEGQQTDVYMQSVREGTIANRQREVGVYWNDPVKIDEALASIDAATADLGRRFGRSAEWIQARQTVESSKALATAIGGALERNDFAAADTLLKRYGARMSAEDLLRMRGVVDKQIDAGIAQQVATQTVRAALPAIQPTDFDRVIGVTMASESGGKRYGADGALLTSPKGAKGEMQVLDSTNQAPGFGVTPARDNSPAERARVGRDYMAAMVKRYDGDLAKAWAAYNAGPGVVDKAIELSATQRSGVAGPTWLQQLPQETQAYVAKNVAAYQAGEGRPTPPTLQDIHAAVRARVGEGNPVRLKLALDEATRQFDDAHKAVKQRDDEAVANAQRWLANNAGRWNLMPASLRAAVPAGQLDNLLGYAERVARGEDRTNPAVYQQLSNQDVLRSLSDNEFYVLSTRELSQADRKHFADQRGKLLSGAAGDKPGDLNAGAVKGVLDTRLRELGLDPTPKDGSSDAQRVGAIRQFVDRSLLDAQASAGKKFTDAEVAKHIDGLFAQTDVVKGWFTDSSAPTLMAQVGDIPKAVKDRLKADFKAAGISDPTDGQLLGAYFLARSAQKQIKRIAPAGKAGGQ